MVLRHPNRFAAFFFFFLSVFFFFCCFSLNAGARCAVCVKHCLYLYLLLFLIWRFLFFVCAHFMHSYGLRSLFSTSGLNMTAVFLIVIFHSFRATFTVFRHTHICVLLFLLLFFFYYYQFMRIRQFDLLFLMKNCGCCTFLLWCVKFIFRIRIRSFFFSVSSTTCIVCMLRSLADYYCFFFLLLNWLSFQMNLPIVNVWLASDLVVFVFPPMLFASIIWRASVMVIMQINEFHVYVYHVKGISRSFGID